MTSNGKVDRRVVRTRKAIVAAFDKLVVERGVEKLTVSAIAREADIDRKTFYLHYSSVDNLIEQMVDASLDRIIAVLRERGEGRPPMERVHIALAEVNDVLTEHLDVYSSIAASLSQEPVMTRFAQAVKLSLERAGVDVDAIGSDDVRMRTQFYVSGAFSLYMTWLKSDHAMPIEAVSDSIELAIQSPVFPTVNPSTA